MQDIINILFCLSIAIANRRITQLKKQLHEEKQEYCRIIKNIAENTVWKNEP